MHARVARTAGIAACLASPRLRTRIPTFGRDDATQGIFLTERPFRGDCDASFAGVPDKRERTRRRFAAQRLAFSLPASWLQRGIELALAPFPHAGFTRSAELCGEGSGRMRWPLQRAAARPPAAGGAQA